MRRYKKKFRIITTCLLYDYLVPRKKHTTSNGNCAADPSRDDGSRFNLSALPSLLTCNSKYVVKIYHCLCQITKFYLANSAPFVDFPPTI